MSDWASPSGLTTITHLAADPPTPPFASRTAVSMPEVDFTTVPACASIIIGWMTREPLTCEVTSANSSLASAVYAALVRRYAYGADEPGAGPGRATASRAIAGAAADLGSPSSSGM